MRKKIKEDLLEILKSLSEAHIAIEDYINNGNTNKAVTLLSDCQNTALQIAGIIENSEGEKFITISFIGEYCKSLYEVAVNIMSFDGGDARALIDEKLNSVKKSAEIDIKVKFEMVFMPYKASMWDSLESVWKAADKDPDCDAYVVPISYYDRNPDHSFGQCHYEGLEFPDYVPITHFNKYNFNRRKPDVIYIHNPYDECNYVTSVDPRFYSKELKKYTDCIVYIPYCLFAHGMSQGLLSAYYNADFISLQSEYYCDFINKDIPREKLLTFGSPKIDMIVNKCREEIDIPDEWKEKIKGRKVFFYNTTIAEMLVNTEIFLRKILYIFRTFQKNDNACLIWRPHPLLEATFDSMRSQFKPIYDNLKTSFINDGIGIYDDTADVIKTIALCDAYIGDATSSVATSFYAVGKPVFILDNRIYDVPTESDYIGSVFPKYYCSLFEKKWFISSNNNLYYSENNDLKFKYLCDLSENSINPICFKDIYEIEDKLFIFPFYGNEIVVIDKNRIIRKIKLKEFGSFRFIGSKKYKKNIYLITTQLDIIKLNTETYEIKYIKTNADYARLMENIVIHKHSLCEFDDYLFIASPTENYIFKLDFKTDKLSLLSVPVENMNGSFSLLRDGNEVWILQCDSLDIIRWNPLSNKIRKYKNDIPGFVCYDRFYDCKSTRYPYFSALFYNDYVYISPSFGNKYIKIDKKIDAVSEWETPFNESFQVKNGYSFYYLQNGYMELHDKTVSVFSNAEKCLFEVDMESNTSTRISFEFDEEEIKKYESGFSLSPQSSIYCCNENALNSLDDFINDNMKYNNHDLKKQLEYFKRISNNCDGTAGEKIYNYIKNYCKGDQDKRS